ncbi:MAG: hypothetical protein AAF806_23100 [Bacteroidota bacterium]
MVLFWKKKRQKSIKSLFAQATNKELPEVRTRVRINEYTMEVNLMRNCSHVHTATAYKDFEIDPNGDFQTDSVVNIYPFPFKSETKVAMGTEEDKMYFYGYKQFEEVFFYRKQKDREVYDLVLPAHEYNLEALDNVFRMIFSSKCIEKQMILLHASCIVKDGKAVLFIGQSGAGKSTISRLSGFPLIHDDLISVKRLGDKKVRIMTVPFKPMFKKHVFEGEIDTIYRIYQSQNNYLETIDKREQLAQMLFALWSFDDFRSEKASPQDRDILRFCKEIVGNVEIKKLYFTKSNDFLKLL